MAPEKRKAGQEDPLVLYDASVAQGFARELLRVMATRRTLGGEGELAGRLDAAFRERWQEEPDTLAPQRVRLEQSNTSILYGNELFFKLFRKLDLGVNPDLEIPRQLSEAGFEHTPAVTGELNYRTDGGGSTVGVLKSYVPNEGDAWSYTLDVLGTYYERIIAERPEVDPAPLDVASLMARAAGEPPEVARDLMGAYMDSAALMGRRTAEMHRALASSTAPDFAPEPFSALYQRSLYQSMRNQAGRTLNELRRELKTVAEDLRPDAEEVLSRRNEILQRMREVVGEKMEAQRIRTHGDYHLGQVLFTGRDFIIIDFEGEPARPMTERRLKRSALSDVAGMLRSFHYAAYTALADEELRGLTRSEAMNGWDRWARLWTAWTGSAFLRAYLEEARAAENGARFVPTNDDHLRTLLEAHMFEKAVYEVGYELNNRPAWVRLPVRGVLQLLDDG